MDAVEKKMKEFNEQLAAAGSPLAMDGAESAVFSQVVDDFVCACMYVACMTLLFLICN